MRRRIRRDRRRLLLHGDSKYSPFRYLSSDGHSSKTFNAESAELTQRTRKHMPEPCLSNVQKILRDLGVEAFAILAPKAGTAARRLPRSSAENARRRRHRSTGDRTRVRAEESSAARIYCSPTPAPCANARGRESRLRDDSRWERSRCRRSRPGW